MGKIKYILIGFLSLIMVSCDGLFGVDRIGKPIKFGTGKPSTRVSYPNIYEGLMQWEKGDEVSIYMTWDGDDYTGTPEFADYNVSLTKNSDRLSYGTLSPSSGKSLKWHGYYKDGRAWEYVHTFYSSYPPRELIKDENNYKFWYDLPSNQDEITMDYAYMAACSNSGDRVYNDDGTVYLEYDPMITTLVVTIKNNTDKSIGNDDTKLTFASKALNVVGEYCVRSYNESAFSFGYFANNDKDSKSVQVTTGPIAAGSSVTKMLFIAPQKYEDLFYTFDDNIERPINDILYPAYKYNITITASGDVELDDGIAQAIALWLLSNSSCWDDLGINESQVNGIRNNHWADPAQELSKIFADKESWEKLLSYLRNASSLNNSDMIIDFPITAEEFKYFFPNLDYIRVKTEAKFEIDGLDNLTYLSLYDHPTSVTVQNCKNLSTIMLDNADGDGTIKITDCPNLEYIKQGNEYWSGPLGNTTKDFILENLSSLKEFILEDAKSVTLKNAPNCSEVKITNADDLIKVDIENIQPEQDPDNIIYFNFSISNVKNLEEVTLKNIPYFNGGTISSTVQKVLALNINNCSNEMSREVYLTKPNGIVNVNKYNSDNVVIQ